ncbi:hypothetical protein BD410DRAFT_100888 [Rickenella mellea]|uniref:BTB domain-containing protein n=1 Tax=Rickenella mellea TaxID=50990 RepID=A0A4Y7PKY6_9AGAM|nr:hypothetical protein BD410DRAFT_100888 [Rickenella mellea]
MPDPRHDLKFYDENGDTCFLVEDILFKFDRKKIESQQSPYFNNLLDAHRKGAKETPIHLAGKSAESFGNLCFALFYSIDFSKSKLPPFFLLSNIEHLLLVAKSAWIYECFLLHNLIKNTLPDRAPPRGELISQGSWEIYVDVIAVMDQPNPKSSNQEKEEHKKYHSAVMNTFYSRVIRTQKEVHLEPDSLLVREILKLGTDHEMFASLLYCFLAYRGENSKENIFTDDKNPIGGLYKGRGKERELMLAKLSECRKWLVSQWPHGVERAKSLKDSDYCLPNHIECRNKLKRKLAAWHESQLTEATTHALWDIMGHFYQMSYLAWSLEPQCTGCFEKFEEAMDPLRTAVRNSLKHILIDLKSPPPDGIWPKLR